MSREIVGRDAEIHRIISSLMVNDCAIHGIFGAPGVGKSALASFLAHRMSEAGWHTILFSLRERGRFDNIDVGTAYVSIAQVLEKLEQEIGSITKCTGESSEASAWNPSEKISRERIHTLFAAAAKVRKLLIVLDDLDEILLDPLGKRWLYEVGGAVNKTPGCHLVIVGRHSIRLQLLDLAITGELTSLKGLDSAPFSDLLRHLDFPGTEEEIYLLHEQAKGLPLVPILLKSQSASLDEALELLGSRIIAENLHEIHDQLVENMLDSLDSSEKKLVKNIFLLLVTLREEPTLEILFRLLKCRIDDSVPENLRQFWKLMLRTRLVDILDVSDISRMPSGPLRFSHSSFRDYLVSNFFILEELTASHRQLANALAGLSSPFGRRNVLFHLARGWEGDEEGLVNRILRLNWRIVIDECATNPVFPVSLLLNDLGNIWSITRYKHRKKISDAIGKTLADRLENSDREHHLAILDIGCSLSSGLTSGAPLIYGIPDSVIEVKGGDSRIVALRKAELCSHLEGSQITDGIKILLDLWPGYYPLFAVEDQLKKAGVVMEIVESSKEKIDILLAGGAQLIVTTPGCLLGCPGYKLDRFRVLGVLNRSFGADKILVDSRRLTLTPDNRIADVKELEECPALVTRNSTSHMFLNSFLLHHGLDPASANIGYRQGYQEVLRAAVDGESVALVSTWEPYAAILQEILPQFKVVHDSTCGSGIIYDLLVADYQSSFRIDGHGRRLEAFGKIYDQSLRQDLARNNTIIESLSRRFGINSDIYNLGLSGVQLFNRHAMRQFFDAQSAESLVRIFERVAKIWGHKQQVGRGGVIRDGFREQIDRSVGRMPQWLSVCAEDVVSLSTSTVEPEDASQGAREPQEIYDVFISYNRDDNSIVKEIVNGLEKSGIRVWGDWKLRAGDDWQAELEEQIGKVQLVVVVVGLQGVVGWQLEEARMAIAESVDRDIAVVAAIIEGVVGEPEIPKFLKNRTWVDFRERKQEGINKLIRSIKAKGLQPADGD